MLIYNYDYITKEFTVVTEAEKNPKNPDDYFVPACATKLVPPDKKDGYAIVWVGNKWEYKSDYRGQAWYNAKTKQIEIIDFIGELPNYYFTPDSSIANPPDGEYWVYDSELQKWVGSSDLYKQYILNIFESYWNLKLNTPYEFEGFKYLPSWRDLYISIYVALKDDIKDNYKLQDYDGNYKTVTLKTMKPILVKMADIVDEMYNDKHNLEKYFKTENNFDKLEKYFNSWLNKEYK